MKKFGLIAIIVGVVGLMVVIFVLGNKAEPAKPETPLVGTQYPNQGQKHIAEGEAHDPYNSNPPTSGPHYSIPGVAPASWGIKDTELADEILIHNLEHGGIVISYKPDLPAEQVQQLKDIFNSLPKSDNFNEVKAVLVPRKANDHPISLTAWTYLEHLDKPDAAMILEFYKSHIDKGPELVM